MLMKMFVLYSYITVYALKYITVCEQNDMLNLLNLPKLYIIYYGKENTKKIVQKAQLFNLIGVSDVH